ncbi:MAG TPA: polysaccharide deacetylase family protein, partial [Candidatus Paceibacterota bacterium]|nr:polysaccharide deacetylase family protein [Candidatus Paceibacterota bacterium]
NILNIFKKHNVSATLFVTGEVLEYCPDLVKKWSKNFEIGCHNYWHNQLDKIDLAERERQVKNFVNLYKGIFGFAPKGFRAPRNVIDNQQFPILERYDFIYDASVFPRYPWRIGAYVGYRGRAPIVPYWPNKKNYKKRCPSTALGMSNKLLEIPESPAPFDVPFVGTWLRKLGVKFFRFIFKIRKPEFVSFSMHSWDGVKFEGKSSKNSGKEFLKQLDEMLGFLKKIGYEFKTGEQISSEIT